MSKNTKLHPLDREFQHCAYTCQKLAEWLDVTDKGIARKWIHKLGEYHSNNVDLKQLRNDIIKKLVEVLKEQLFVKVTSSANSETKLTHYHMAKVKEEIDRIGDPVAQPKLIQKLLEVNQSSYMALWSPDKKTYLAIKPLSGEGALIYLATTPDPELGWDIPSTARGAATDDCDGMNNL